MARKLKVFRMAVGFEDAYVAAPSRKAALAAWGSEHDQFARGLADEVFDPQLMREPLARPGTVIRKSRGDLAAQLKAVPAARHKSPKAPPTAPPRAGKASKPKPQPRRDKIDAAEAALTEARDRYAAAIAKVEAERDAIEAKLAALEDKRDNELLKLTRRRDEAKETYRAALETWSAANDDE